MNGKSSFLAIVCIALVSCFSHANEVFISFSDLGEADVQTNDTLTIGVGDTASAFVWIEASEDIDTLVVTDFLLSASSIVALTGGEVFNPNIVDGGGIVSGTRWDSTGDGELAVDGVALSGAFGFATGLDAGTGIVASQTATGTQSDTFFDATAGAFLFARIDFQANDRGTVDINPNGISLNGGVLDNLSVTSGTINVIPEPSVCVLLLIGAAGALSSRRRV